MLKKLWPKLLPLFRNKFFFFTFSIFFIASLVVYKEFNPSPASYLTAGYQPLDPKVALKQIQDKNENVFQYLLTQMQDVLNHEDVDGTIALTQEAFKQEVISMYECHTIAHEIGHHAAIDPLHFNHIEIHVSRENIDFCGGGFKHGVEAGLADSQTGDFREKLYSFCILTKPISDLECYHGAGHTFMHNASNPKEALVLCESLIVGEEITPNYCFRGVFSEYVDRLQRQGQQGKFLLDFCASLDSDKQSLCGLELNGLGITDKSTEDEIAYYLGLCTDKKYGIGLKRNCLVSVAAVAAQHLLAKQDKITPPTLIFSLDKDLKLAYIEGTMGETNKLLENGAQKDWQSFCEAFPAGEDQTTCRQFAI